MCRVAGYPRHIWSSSIQPYICARGAYQSKSEWPSIVQRGLTTRRNRSKSGQTRRISPQATGRPNYVERSPSAYVYRSSILALAAPVLTSSQAQPVPTPSLKMPQHSKVRAGKNRRRTSPANRTRLVATSRRRPPRFILAGVCLWKMMVSRCVRCSGMEGLAENVAYAIQTRPDLPQRRRQFLSYTTSLDSVRNPCKVLTCLLMVTDGSSIKSTCPISFLADMHNMLGSLPTLRKRFKR